MKFKKRKKSSRRFGSQTAFRGAKERTRNSGSRGGVGMAGTGKRADQKKTYVIKLTGGNNYFGKDRTLRAGKKQPKLKVINLSQISLQYHGKKEIDLTGYKILGEGDLNLKTKIRASKASESAIQKIKSSESHLELEENFSDLEKEGKKE